MNSQQKPTQTILFIFVSFWATVLVVRGVIFWYVRQGIIPRILVNGWHIHHFVTGFVFLIVAAVVASRSEHRKYIPGMIAGVGLALVCDEILYWTRYSFDYWSLVNFLAITNVGTLLALWYQYTRERSARMFFPLKPHVRQWLFVFVPVILSFAVLLHWFSHFNYTAARAVQFVSSTSVVENPR